MMLKTLLSSPRLQDDRQNSKISKKKIEKSEDDQERLEELKENIRKKNIRLANEQILLIVQAMKYDMEI